MKRVAMELQYFGPLSKDPALEYMLLQAVRFAFRMHQVTHNVAVKYSPQAKVQKHICLEMILANFTVTIASLLLSPFHIYISTNFVSVISLYVKTLVYKFVHTFQTCINISAVCWRFRPRDHGCIRRAEESSPRQEQHSVARI
jgi:hypothetical protein